MAQFVNDRTLDYVPRLVEANNQYLITTHPRIASAAPGVDLTKYSRFWTGGTVLDQGQEGSCVGHGVVGEYFASPVRGVIHTPSLSDAEAGHQLAVRVYNRAKEIDEWEGVDYDGTAVRAGMLVGREKGWWDSFYWAKNLFQLRTALELGPVVIGITWLEGMYETDAAGMVRVEGEEVGGHCLLITGYSPSYGSHGARFRWRNSWGLSYGLSGNGYITPADLDKVLFQAGNECAVPSGRHFGTV